MVKFRKITAVLCVICLLAACFAGCGSEAEAPAASEQPKDFGQSAQSEAVGASGNTGFGQTDTSRVAPAYNTGVITNIGLDAQGHLQITRDPAKNEPMGDPGTWTIFVYLCGSDLESEHGLASGDLQEMIDGSADSAARYIVMTGGSTEWHNEVVDSESLGIYLVEDGGIELLEQWENDYMNDPETLHAFLNWGIENYPAEKMGLIFWNHGGGSVDGVCVDGHFSSDVENGVLEDTTGYYNTLILSDISSVLSQVFANMTDQFEFIGYDACLMGTLENAFMVSPYARYMYASEEIEPGYGWDYVAIGQAIGSGKITGDRLGKVVTESYYLSCAEADSEQNSTFAIIDLARIDELIKAFDSFAVNMVAAMEEPENFSKIVRKMRRVEFYGGNSEGEGYFNLADLGGMAKALSSTVDGSSAVLKALEQVIVYSKFGEHHKNSNGLSVYYPLSIEDGSAELGIFATVACSPYYYEYVAQTVYAGVNGGMEGYDSAVSLNAWASAMDSDVENIVEYYGHVQITGASPYVEFYDEPQIFEGGTYGFSLTDASMPYVDQVEANVYFISDDGEDLVFLGSTTDIDADWENGIFMDNFDGLWFCLPDGQLIAAYVVSEDDDFAIYTTPVLLNGEQSNLRFVVDYSDYSVTLDGVWTGEETSGFAGRNIYKLKPGDIIQPLFEAAKIGSGEAVEYWGEEYVYDGTNDWAYNELFDARYFYQFCIYDIYGDNYTTEGTYFNVENGEIFFEMDAA